MENHANRRFAKKDNIEPAHLFNDDLEDAYFLQTTEPLLMESSNLHVAAPCERPLLSYDQSEIAIEEIIETPIHGDADDANDADDSIAYGIAWSRDPLLREYPTDSALSLTLQKLKYSARETTVDDMYFDNEKPKCAAGHPSRIIFDRAADRAFDPKPYTGLESGARDLATVPEIMQDLGDATSAADIGLCVKKYGAAVIDKFAEDWIVDIIISNKNCGMTIYANRPDIRIREKVFRRGRHLSREEIFRRVVEMADNLCRHYGDAKTVERLFDEFDIVPNAAQQESIVGAAIEWAIRSRPLKERVAALFELLLVKYGFVISVGAHLSALKQLASERRRSFDEIACRSWFTRAELADILGCTQDTATTAATQDTAATHDTQDTAATAATTATTATAAATATTATTATTAATAATQDTAATTATTATSLGALAICLFNCM